MNLLDKKLGLLLIVALTLFACEEELSTINLGPENNLGIFFGETSLADNVSQVWAGSSPSSYNGQLLAGHYQDPVFGDVSAAAYCDISFYNVSYSEAAIGAAQFLSLNLALRISAASGTYNSNDVQTLELYKLSESVDPNADFNSSLKLPIGEKIGDAQFKLHKDSINYVYNDNGTPGDSYDSDKRYIYKTKFTLTDSYKLSFFQGFKDAVSRGLPTDSLDIDSVSYFFDQNIKGIAIVGKDQNNAIISYNTVDATSLFDLKYIVGNDSTTALFNINALKSFNNIEPNEDIPWSNSVFNDVTELNTPFKTNDENAYFQSGTNMFIALNLSGFNAFKDTLNSQNVLIQRAELVIDNIVDSESNIQTPTSIGVFPASLDSISSGSFNNFMDKGLPSEIPGNSNFSITDNKYSIELALYLQAIVDNKTNLDYLVLDANKILQNNNTRVPYVGKLRDNNTNRFVVKKEDIKIRYYYSIPDKN